MQYIRRPDALLIVGLSTDEKPVDHPEYTQFFEVNTGKTFVYYGGLWRERPNLVYVWDVDTMSPVLMTQPVIKTDVLNVAADVTPIAPQANDYLPVRLTDGNAFAGKLTTRIDEAGGGVTYIGEAQVGTAEASPAWRIQKIIDTSGDVQILWADGNTAFDNAWTDRAGLSYS